MSSERKLPLTALCLALAAVFFAFCWNLRDPFLSDDYILVSRASMNTPSITWYFKNPGGDGSFRPIGFLYFSVVSHFGGTEPWKWHICGLMLHLLNCALLYLLTWRLWRNLTISLGSLLLFGLHGTRPEVVVWTAGSFDSLACLFVLLTLCWVFQPARDQRWFVSLVVIAGLVVLAIWSKESGYALPFMLGGFAYAARRHARPAIRRSFLWAVLICAALLTHRFILFGGPGGYVDPQTGRSAIFSLNFLSVAKVLLQRLWAVLVFPVDWDAGDRWSLTLCAALTGLAFAGLMAAADSGSFRNSAAMIAMTALAILPAIHLALIGPSELGSRILYLPSVGFCVMCAYLTSSIRSLHQQRLVQAALAVSVLVVLTHNLVAWHRTALLADQFCTNMVSSHTATTLGSQIPSSNQGVPFFANGLPECTSMKTQTLRSRRQG